MTINVAAGAAAYANAAKTLTAPQGAGATSGGGFADMLKSTLEGAVTDQQKGEQASMQAVAGTGDIHELLGQQHLQILAISVGAVFFGAATYIGNGPNFMVKAIADHQKIRTPSFFGFILKFTLPFLLPMLIIIWLVFFRD